MSSAGSVTCWIAQLKAGERAASQPLWENYFEGTRRPSRSSRSSREDRVGLVFRRPSVHLLPNDFTKPNMGNSFAGRNVNSLKGDPG
jgi:hypothetical protein